jgi:hypothetical protein
VAAGAALAVQHPLWPQAVLAVFLGWCLLAAWRPDLWPLVVLAGLPLLNFSPWSGWFGLDEFDLLVLGAIAGGYGRLATRPPVTRPGYFAPWPPVVAIATALFVGASGISLWRGVTDAGGEFDAFQSYLDPMNSLRVFKPLLLVLLLVPLIGAELTTSPERAMRRVGAGMWTGLAVVTISVLWERIAYPGLIDFSKRYRAVGLFWEMHVGGAAIDTYLAMAVPFVAWALWSARTRLRWSIAAALALLAAYACLTTFSRGVYIAVLLPLLVLGAVARGWTPSLYWRRRAGRVLIAILLVEVFAVIWTGSFLIERMAKSDRDLRGRIAHWTNGLRLLHHPADLALGIGLGRLPSHFTRFVDGYEFSGAVRPGTAADGRNSVRLAGPASRGELAGLYWLTQRVALREKTRYRVEFDYHVDAETVLFLRVCELHLLYERRCQSRVVVVKPGQSPWQHQALDLEGPGLEAGPWFAPRMAVFEMSVLGAAMQAAMSKVQLKDGVAGNLLRNGDFSDGLAHWLPSAQSYFVPWHIDNLYLEILVERGPLALVGFLVVAVWTLRRSAGRPVADGDLAPFLAASLLGALLIGALSSVMDASRSAFLLFFLLAFAAMLGRLKGEAPRADI